MKMLKRYPLVIFSILAVLFAGFWEGLYDIFGAGNPVFSILALFFASYGPTVGTLVVLLLLHDAEETRAWRSRLVKFRVNWRWYLLAMLLPAFAWLAGIGLTTVFGGQFPFHPLLLVVFPFLLLANTGEELGWRGFVLPRLLKRFNSLTASIIVGVMWGLFHLLLYIQTLYTFLPFLCLIVAFSILMTWVFNHTGSVPLMVIMHASLDTIQFVSPVNQTFSTVIAFALISLVMWLIALLIILRTGPDLGRTRKVGVASSVETPMVQSEV